MKNNKSWIQYIVSPYSIGIFITFGYVLFSWRYYNATHLEEGQRVDNFFLQALQTAHQKTIDMRLKQRGPRSPSPEVALLAVDEQAVQTLGRWPWPREIIAKAIDRAVSLGAKVIAFDAVFSEPTYQPSQEIFSSLKQKNLLSPQAENAFNQALKDKDSDQIFADAIKRNADHIVMGSFFNSNNNYLLRTTFPNRCFNFIYENSPAYKIWNNEDQFLVIVDQNEVYMPDAMSSIYQEHLKTIAEEITRQTPIPKNLHESLSLNEKIQHNQIEYCRTWLNPQEDLLYSAIEESWSQVRSEEDNAQFPFQTFTEFVTSFKQKYPRNLVMVAENWVMNTPEISIGAKHTGYFNAHLDEDGTIRRKQLVVRSGEHFMPSLSLKAFLLAKGYNVQIQLGEDAKYQSKVIKKFSIINNEDGQPLYTVPVDAQGSLMINYAGPQNMFPYMSIAELLSDSPQARISQNLWDSTKKIWKPYQSKQVNKADWLKNKIFVFGATAVGIYDLRVTPFDENFPGAETHLNVIDNLIRKDFLRHHPDEDIQMPLVLLVVGLLLTFAIAHLGALSGLILTMVTLFATLWIDKYALFSNGYVTTIIHPLILILSLYVSLTFYKYFTEERNKKELRSIFQKYVSPAIVEEILSDPEKIELGGRKELMTVFFSDVRGFTTISEQLDPRALSDLLNSYLTPMTEIVFQNRGTLDKYMGDAIMAFFGAPIPLPDHAQHACRAALKSLDKLKELQAIYKAKNLPPIDIGIGLNTGEMSVGNMGSETVRNYTVMGDAVNLGSRLEGINKQYGTRIIISEFTYQAAKDNFLCREIDWVRVKGKALPVKIYELITEKRSNFKIDASLTEMLKRFEEGYTYYHERQWEKALQSFNQALTSHAGDPASQLYIERCQEFIAEPPADNWDGVFIMKTK